jgi:hypothetical protein
LTEAGGTSDLAVALIAAGAALLGAIVGGLITAIATFKIEERKQAFERKRDAEHERLSQDRELRLARATALASYPRYLSAAAIFGVALEKRRFWQEGPAIDERPSFEDRKLLAAHMTRRDRELVVRGELMLRSVFETRKRSEEWTEDAAEAIQDAHDKVDQAWRALKTFGEAAGN